MADVNEVQRLYTAALRLGRTRNSKGTSPDIDRHHFQRRLRSGIIKLADRHSTERQVSLGVGELAKPVMSIRVARRQSSPNAGSFGPGQKSPGS